VGQFWHARLVEKANRYLVYLYAEKLLLNTLMVIHGQVSESRIEAKKYAEMNVYVAFRL